MNSTKKNAKVALFMLFGLIIFAGGIILISSMRKVFIKKISAVAVFQDVAGLTKGNNVWFSGVKVGTVESLEFIPDKGVKVNFQIEEKSQQYIFKDADVKISTDGLIGNPILVISGGNISQGVIEDGHIFKISREDSQQDMIKTLQENNKNILAITDDLKNMIASIDSGKGNLGKFLKDETLFNEVSQTVGQLRASSYQVTDFAKSLNQFGQKLNDPQGLPYQLATNKTIMPKLESTVNSLESGASSLQKTAGNAEVLVNEVKSDLNRITSSKNSALGVLINNPEMADYMKSTMINVESGTEKLDENLEALQHSIFFRKYFRKKEKREKEAAKAMDSE